MRLHAHRGNTLTAGAVVLTAFAVEAELRGLGPRGVRLGLVAALFALTAWAGVRSPREAGGIRVYQEVLLVLAVAAGTGTLAQGAVVLGLGPGAPVAAGWAALVALGGALLAAALTRGRDATMAPGAGALLGLVALVAGAGALWPGDDPRVGVRLALLVAMVALTVGIVDRLERRYRQAIVLADVLAVVLVLLAGTFLLPHVPGAEDALGLPPAAPGAAWGWQALLLVAGFGLVGVGSTLHEHGPGWLGALGLVAALVVLADGHHAFVGWPLALLVAGCVLVAVALRPVEHVVVPEEQGADPPPPVPWPRAPLTLVGPPRRADEDDDEL
ncbi:hypothetical protein [Patulibacter sp. SYSU D01012]|uniref:hypothetical protein n=1 Tax=Patulibacter sp. SYSU D01012 TaxID=2817381 RepID=UPI001B30E38B|nr:hypothetical protein [Patulibacter sp. SYSU D01012]